MEKYNIANNYQYWYFKDQAEFFDCLENELNKGRRITDSIHLCVELDKQILLSYIKVDTIDINIKETLKSLDLNYKLVKPNYDKCILNAIASIRKYYGKEAWYKTDTTIDKILQSKKYNNICIMLLDGMGENVLDYHLKDGSFLKKNHSYTNTAIYPSTTAASTTATKNGLSPIQTGWLGWENYFSEIDRNIILFNGKNYLTDEDTGFNTYKVLPYKFFFEDIDVKGSIIEPDFSIKDYSFKDVLDKSLKSFDKNRNNIQYIYYTSPDNLMHEYGAYSSIVTQSLNAMDEQLKDYASKLPNDTLLIISADHGHTDVLPIDFYACKTINKMLIRRPSNDSRCITFKVKEEYKKQFIKTFEDIFGYAYDIYPSKQLIEEGYFGLPGDKVFYKSLDFLADFVAVAKNNYYFNYKNENNMLFKSHHAGITADEMLVPLIIYKK